MQLRMGRLNIIDGIESNNLSSCIMAVITVSNILKQRARIVRLPAYFLVITQSEGHIRNVMD